MKAVIFSLLVLSGVAHAEITVQTLNQPMTQKSQVVNADQYVQIDGDQAVGLYDQMNAKVIQHGNYDIKVTKMGSDISNGVVECYKTVDYVTRKPVGDAGCFIGRERLLPPGTL